MKIFYDHQIFELQKFGGISRYFLELISQLQKHEDLDYQLSIKYSNNAYLQHLPEASQVSPKLEKEEYIKHPVFGQKGTVLLNKLVWKLFYEKEAASCVFANKEESIKTLKKGDFDVFHPTYYDPYFLDYIGDKPFVLTVHDLVHEIFPEYSLQDSFLKDPVVLQQAHRIIAISENTKKDLVSILGVDERKIEVIYLGNSLQPNSAKNWEELYKRLPKNYLLFVGNREIYKNFYFFAQIFSSLQKEHPDLHIVCTGPSITKKEQLYFQKLGITNKVHHIFTTDEELGFLYKNALAFVFPSLYEGFGIPLLEAFSCGCPVLASRSSSLTEVGGDAVMYFDPKNAESMIRALKQVLNSAEVRNDLIAKGASQLAKFSWEKTFDSTLEVYRSASINKSE